MGFIRKLFGRAISKFPKLPSGAFTLDRDGHVVVSTMPQAFSETQMREIGNHVLEFFRGAEHAQIPLHELNVYYPSLKVTARSLRGGAIVYLLPQNLPKN